MSLLAPGRNLVLIGMMGSGKSTVGSLLAARLGRRFADTDAAVERVAGASVQATFDRAGERVFRALESEEVRKLAALRGQVLAVGGGAVLDPSNVTFLRATGDLVLLDAPPKELAARMGDDNTRPLLAGAGDPVPRLANLRAERDEVYRAAAAHLVDTHGRTPAEVAERVLEWAISVPGLLTRTEREAL